MKKLVKGIAKFRNDVLPNYRDTFARLALGQSPDALYIGCSDSRVAVNVFASTDPGDLFVIRNVGNLVPPCDANGISTADASEGAALEFALNYLKVSSIVVCGHSECGAMQAISNGRSNVPQANLRAWLRHGDISLQTIHTAPERAKGLAPHNRLSQVNVIRQLDHLRTYPIVQKLLEEKKLSLHGWWFEVSRADVYAYEEDLHEFVLIDEVEADLILKRLGES